MNAASGAVRDRAISRRLDWLRQHPALNQLPGIGDDVDAAASALLDAVRAEMQSSGLYARTSTRAVVKFSIRVLVSELRGQHIQMTGRW